MKVSLIITILAKDKEDGWHSDSHYHYCYCSGNREEGMMNVSNKHMYKVIIFGKHLSNYSPLYISAIYSLL
jgi:hypothetical protein